MVVALVVSAIAILVLGYWVGYRDGLYCRCCKNKRNTRRRNAIRRVGRIRSGTAAARKLWASRRAAKPNHNGHVNH